MDQMTNRSIPAFHYQENDNNILPLSNSTFRQNKVIAALSFKNNKYLRDKLANFDPKAPEWNKQIDVNKKKEVFRLHQVRACEDETCCVQFFGRRLRGILEKCDNEYYPIPYDNVSNLNAVKRVYKYTGKGYRPDDYLKRTSKTVEPAPVKKKAKQPRVTEILYLQKYCPKKC